MGQDSCLKIQLTRKKRSRQRTMEIENDPWEAIGTLEEDEAIHVLTKLYSMYERSLKKDDACAHLFFQRLHQAIEQSKECNLNRR